MRVLVVASALMLFAGLSVPASSATLDLSANNSDYAAVAAVCPTALAFSEGSNTKVQPVANVEMNVQPIEPDGTQRVSFVNRKTNQAAALTIRVGPGGAYNVLTENMSYSYAKHVMCILPSSTK